MMVWEESQKDAAETNLARSDSWEEGSPEGHS